MRTAIYARVSIKEQSCDSSYATCAPNAPPANSPSFGSTLTWESRAPRIPP